MESPDHTETDGSASTGRGPVGARVAAVLLFLLGAFGVLLGGYLVLLMAGAFTSGAVATCVGITCALQVFFSVVGVLIVVIGVAHMAAAWGSWRRRTWGRWLGAVLAVPAFVLVALALSKEVTSRQFALGWVPFTIAYAAVLVGLWRWERRFIGTSRHGVE